jgi:hypothetical protein
MCTKFFWSPLESSKDAYSNAANDKWLDDDQINRVWRHHHKSLSRWSTSMFLWPDRRACHVIRKPCVMIRSVYWVPLTVYTHTHGSGSSFSNTICSGSLASVLYIDLASQGSTWMEQVLLCRDIFHHWKLYLLDTLDVCVTSEKLIWSDYTHIHSFTYCYTDGKDIYKVLQDRDIHDIGWPVSVD